MDPLQKLAALTYAVQHNPNCPKPFLIRLVGPGAGKLDFKNRFGTDAMGYGETLEEAIEEVLKESKRMETLRKEKWMLGGFQSQAESTS